jgi:lipopolysaccharide/colanic/teichoic acid biosynthesis glycosyltransferase
MSGKVALKASSVELRSQDFTSMHHSSAHSQPSGATSPEGLPFSAQAVAHGFRYPRPPASPKSGDAPIDGALPGLELPRWKRFLDLAVISLTWFIWFPLMLLLMLAIKIVSPGPVFYRQARIGLRRKIFMIYKFRSMKANAETRLHEAHLERLMNEECPMTKLDAAGDPRLIPLGRLLRASGLDELPQLFNVLRGEMSLIGPRPCTPHEFQRYQSWQRERTEVLPGMTGYWQVSGKNKTTFNEMIAMDISYVRRMSLCGDLVIIAKTLPAMVSQCRESWQSRPANRNNRKLFQGAGNAEDI